MKRFVSVAFCYNFESVRFMKFHISMSFLTILVGEIYISRPRQQVAFLGSRGMFSLKGAPPMGLQIESNAATLCAMCSSMLEGDTVATGVVGGGSSHGCMHGVCMVYIWIIYG